MGVHGQVAPPYVEVSGAPPPVAREDDKRAPRGARDRPAPVECGALAADHSARLPRLCHSSARLGQGEGAPAEPDQIPALEGAVDRPA